MEFHDWFAREEDCRAYLVRTRWPEGFNALVVRREILGG